MKYIELIDGSRVEFRLSKAHYLFFSKDLKIYQKGACIFIEKNDVKTKLKLISSPLKRVFLKSRLLQRLFRTDIRSCAFGNNHFVFGFKSDIYSLNLNDLNLKKGNLTSKSKSSPLYIKFIANSKNYKNGFYFGEYLSNDNRNKVNLFYSSDGLNWLNVFTFSQGEINHIHNVAFDSSSDRFYVLTGDFDKAANIWLVDSNYNSASSLIKNNQFSRCCHLCFLNNKLFFCTDYPDKQNYFLSLNNSFTDEPIIIDKINGSSIFGMFLDNGYIYSTCVEPDYSHKTKMGYLFSRRRGSGILSNYVFCYRFFRDKNIPILKFKKDFFPSGLFQFGNISFPLQESNEYVVLYCQSIKKYDGKTLFLRKKDFYECNN